MLANRTVRMGLVGVLIVVIGYMFVLPRMQSSDAEAAVPEHPNPGPTYTLEAKVYNLLTPAAQTQRYLKVGMVFEFEAEDPAFFELEGEALAVELEHFAETLAPKRPILEDAVGGLVASKTLDDISTALGRQQFKDELREAVGGIVGEPQLLTVYLTEFVFQ